LHKNCTGACFAVSQRLVNIVYPPTPGVVRIDIKGKHLQIGMLEVVENKEATFAFELHNDAFESVEEGLGGRLVRTSLGVSLPVSRALGRRLSPRPL
jgi:hypothetical protein